MFLVDDSLSIPTTVLTMIIYGFALSAARKEIETIRCVASEFEYRINSFASQRLRVDNVLSEDEKLGYDKNIAAWKKMATEIRKAVEDEQSPVGSIQRIKWIIQYKSSITLTLNAVGILLPIIEKKEQELRKRELRPVGKPQYYPRGRIAIATFLKRVHTCTSSFEVTPQGINSFMNQIDVKYLTFTLLRFGTCFSEICRRIPGRCSTAIDYSPPNQRTFTAATRR
ncbi:hypothetical protein EDC01DRAFT_68812 [Geopyxis carbonaria]|nr:hypothetical protein EDC01DRAFT_68812 [Geopyxis carbonaria]